MQNLKRMSPYIRNYLIDSISKKIRERIDELGFQRNEVIWFNEPIYRETTKKYIDRYGCGFFYNKDDVSVVGWGSIPGPMLVSIYKRLKNNEVYFKYNIDGRDFKIRNKSKKLYPDLIE